MLREVVRPAREQAGLDSSGIEQHDHQTESLLFQILDLNDDVAVVIIRIDGQCYCANLDLAISLSLKLRRAVELLIAERQAQLTNLSPGKFKPLVEWGGLHVVCTQDKNDQRVAGEQFEINNELLIRCGRDVRVVSFVYSANERGALGLKKFLEAIVKDTGNLIKLAVPPIVHAGHANIPSLERSRVFHALAPALDFCLGLALEGSDQLEIDYKHDGTCTAASRPSAESRSRSRQHP